MKTPAHTETSNPLSRIALELPPSLSPAISIGARGIGAALALYITQDQSYDRTQVLTIGLAVAALLSIVPLPRGIGDFAPALGAGALFFGGAALAGETPAAGIAMLIAGAAAACGALIANHRAGASPASGVVAFFAGLALDIAGVVAIALTIEG